MNFLIEGKTLDIQQHVSGFKELGVIQFNKVLSIPQHDRIQDLLKLENGYKQVGMAITGSLKNAFDVINLRVGLTDQQLLYLAAQIIEEAKEDNLALEDVLLFLNNLITGKAGKIYDRMDIPTFFELFETYRQERYEALQNIREEEQSQFRAMGDQERTSKRDELDEHFNSMAGRLSDLKNNLRETIKENRILRNDL